MTLIASTSNFGFPIMMGDILATSNDISEELIIPLFSQGVNQYLPSYKKYLPSKFVQKIYIISDTIAVGFAGSEYEIKYLLIDLINYFKYKESTLLELKNFMGSIDDEMFGKSSALFMFLEEGATNFFTLKHNDFKIVQNDAFDVACATGSGSEYFITLLRNQTFLAPDKTSSLMQAIARNFLPLGKSLAHEFINLKTIIDGWGVGFEMIYAENNKFMKMDNITYVLWTGEVDLDEMTLKFGPNIIYNFKYIEDLLVLAVYDFASNQFLRYIVRPLYKESTDVDVHMIAKAHKVEVDDFKICNVFCFQKSDKSFYTFSRFVVNGNMLGGEDYLHPREGHEFMFSDGKYNPGVSINFNHYEDVFDFTFYIAPYYAESIRSRIEGWVIDEYGPSSSELRLL